MAGLPPLMLVLYRCRSIASPLSLCIYEVLSCLQLPPASPPMLVNPTTFDCRDADKKKTSPKAVQVSIQCTIQHLQIYRGTSYMKKSVCLFAGLHKLQHRTLSTTNSSNKVKFCVHRNHHNLKVPMALPIAHYNKLIRLSHLLLHEVTTLVNLLVCQIEKILISKSLNHRSAKETLIWFLHLIFLSSCLTVALIRKC